MGAFLSRDPVEGVMGRVASRNGYGYVEGNPVNAVDLSGEKPWWMWRPSGGGTPWGGGRGGGLVSTGGGGFVGGSRTLAPFGQSITRFNQGLLASGGVCPVVPENPTPLRDLEVGQGGGGSAGEGNTPRDENEPPERFIRVRHYSSAINAIKISMKLGGNQNNGAISVFVQYPFNNTPRTEEALAAKYREFGLGFYRKLTGIVEFNLDKTKWVMKRDSLLLDVSDAWEIKLIESSVPFAFETGISLSDPGVNPEFYDASGQLIR